MSSVDAHQRLTWFWNRLSCMSVVEIGYRVWQLIISQVSKRGLRRSNTIDTTPMPTDIALWSKSVEVASSGYCHEADNILAGKIILFGKKNVDIGFRPNWNKDPKTGVQAPHRFGLDIAISDPEQVGDIKYIWELNRHLHLVRLAQAYHLSGDQRYIHGIEQHIDSWLQQCPPLMGVNWASGLELAIRLINWSLVWELVGGCNSVMFQGNRGVDLRTRWLHSIYEHITFIRRHLSRFSSANNHLIGELTGIYIATCTWPFSPEMNKWKRWSRLQLEREISRQFSRDGVNREQAFAYHLFTMEFLMLAGICGEHTKDYFSATYWETIFRALRFVDAVRDIGKNIPTVGDADDGCVLRLTANTHGGGAERLLALGDAICNSLSEGGEDDARWLLGQAWGARFPSWRKAFSAWAFPDGGYYVFGSNFNKSNEIKGLMDVGGLGYLGIAAHGHADALSLTLSLGGEPCLVDPGTYSYWSDIKWRNYFRGTSAHNTVRIDKQDQSVSGGRFMWTQKAQTQVKQTPQSSNEFVLTATHDGYLRLQDPAIHSRSVEYQDSFKRLIVRDAIIALKSHLVEQFWHFAPGLIVQLEDNKLTISGKKFVLIGTFHGANLALQLTIGEQDPPLGWYSDSYENKQPSYVLCVSATGAQVHIDAVFDIFIESDHGRH